MARFFPLLALFALQVQAADAPAAPGEGPPRFSVPAPESGPLVFVTYGDTRFTPRDGVANPIARRALAEHIAGEHPAAILIGGDLVYQGSDPGDYETYRIETARWRTQNVSVFPALGNHEFRGCAHGDVGPCLENWWKALSPLSLRPYRWYSVSFGSSLLAIVLDSDSGLKKGSEQRAWLERQVAEADGQFRFILIVLHYPPVRDPLYPRARDEKEVARYLAAHAPSLRSRIVVVGSHLHNYERYSRDGVVYLVSGGGGAKPHPAPRLFGEESQLRTSVNFHYVRFVLDGERLSGTMVRFETSDHASERWSEPDHFEVRAKN